ncbi:MAG: TonB-dependent receptor [Caulobacteraceae bacterium]|nr:TonB-dependent receptor [Caulobacteraceae bacterium]
MYWGRYGHRAVSAAHLEGNILKHLTVRDRLMASSMICGALSLGLAGTAMAQTAPQTAPPSTVQEVVVTGTRIQNANLASVSPVTTVNNAEIKLSGASRVEDLINSLPQSFAGQGSAVGNGATGTATVNLRGLGTPRTLVLIDGRRLVPGDPAYSNNNPVPDLNFIPTALVDRVEVLTGGASATYGSDAVAGVVNFIMQKNFTGIKIDANAGFYDHDNNNTMMQGLEKARGFGAPSGSKIDGWQKDVTLTLGVNSPDNKGNAEVYMGYRQIDAVSQGARDYGACSLSESGPGFACAGSGTTALSHFLVFTPTGTAVGDPNGYILDPTGNGTTVRPYVASRDAYNFAPFNYYQRPDTRYTAGVLSHYELNEHADVYAQVMFMDDQTSSQVAPSGVFGQTVNIPCNSSLLSAQEVATFCTAAGQGPTGTATLALLKRNVEGGARIDNLRHTDYRLLIGSKGAIDKTWSYDAYAQYGTAIFAENFQNDFSLLRSGNALASCTLFAQTGCVPYNAFAIGGISQTALNYVSAAGFQSGSTVEQVVSATVSGALGDYGIKSPWSTDGVGIAVGTEYRREEMTLKTDDEYSSGDLAGQGGARGPVAGVYDVKEVFTEVNVPLAKDMVGIQTLTLNTGYRYSDYSTSGRTDTYKIGGEWAPVSDIKFRAGYNRAVRAPNLNELYAATGVALDGSIDPCAGTSPAASFAACAKTGVTAAQYGHIAINSANQYNGQTGGNVNLQPEKSDTISFGFVAQPRFIPGFNLTVDYFDIKVNNVIGTAGADLIITQCVQTGDPFYCSKIVRAPGTGSLWLGTNGYIQDTNFNLGSIQTKGVDFTANYRLPLASFGWDRYGRFDVNFQGTLLNSFVTTTIPGGSSYDCVGLYGTVCDVATGGAPAPKFRSKTRLTWQTPWNIQASAAWRHVDSVMVDSSSSNPNLKGTVNPGDAKLNAFDYFDLSANWRIKDQYTLRVGVNNLMDLQPPLVGSGHLAQVYGNGNTYPQVYDALGRYIFMGITAQF